MKHKKPQNGAKRFVLEISETGEVKFEASTTAVPKNSSLGIKMVIAILLMSAFALAFADFYITGDRFPLEQLTKLIGELGKLIP